MLKPKTNQSYHKPKLEYFIKNNLKVSKKENKLQNRSLSISVLSKNSNKSASFINNGVKLTDSYYNDRQNIYLKQSRILSQKSVGYQTNKISYSERKKYNQKKIQNIMHTRSRTQGQEKSSNSISKTMSLPKMKPMNSQIVKNKINSLNDRKFTQLLTRSKSKQNKIKLLQKQINQIRQQNINSQKKWMSPFKNTDRYKLKFEGKKLLPEKVQGIMSNSSTTQLKVLNLDRLFRMKNGKLNNVVQIPIAKLSEISARPNLVKTIKKKDTIHDVIQQFNKLLKLSRAIKTSSKRIGIRGHNFTKSPTIEEMMGIKIHEVHLNKSYTQAEQQQLNQQVFLSCCEYYKNHMKKDIHLARRLITGLIQDGKFDLAAFTRFYSIFVNKIANLDQKIKFLLYFFIPVGQQRIQIQVMKIILQVMCQKLPELNSLKVQSHLLTKQQKSKIFLQALNRVLFAGIKQCVGSDENSLYVNRPILDMLFRKNEDAIGLLIRLLLLE